jgi:hypothetical protein
MSAGTKIAKSLPEPDPRNSTRRRNDFRPIRSKQENRMKKKNKSQTQTLTGIILPVDWDENDEVSSVQLSATDDEDYLISNGEKFLNMVHCWISATGNISRDKRSGKNIRITRYEIMEDEDGFNAEQA